MRWFHPRVVVGGVGLGLIIIGFSLLIIGGFIPPRAVLIAPTTGEKVGLGEPLKVKFNIPIARRFVTPVLKPEVEGSWRWESGLLGGHLSRTLIFEPENVWAADQAYTLTLNGLSPAVGQQTQKTQQLTFQARSLPTIVAATVSEDNIELPPSEPLSFQFDQPLLNEVDFTFTLEPTAELSVEKDYDNHRIVLRPNSPLQQGTVYRLIAQREVVKISQASGTVESRSDKETVLERLFRVKAPPAIAHFEPQGTSVLPDTKEIKIGFSTAMVRAEVDERLTLEPALEGSWQWSDDQTLLYRFNKRLPLETKFRVVIRQGAHGQNGSFLEQDLELGFQTVGSLRISSLSPSNNQAGVNVGSSIRLTFDQPVDQASVLSHLTLSPAVAVDSSWSNQALTLKPQQPLAYNTRYTITLRQGTVSQFGLPSRQDYVFSFSTEEKVVLINIAWDRQDRALSCEAAALKMALAGKGVRVSEDDIMSRVGYDPTPRGPGVWGDPDQAFVGDINGAQNSTGYGVHWAPIARAANAWRPSRAVSGLSLNQAAAELEKGNPIVIWGVTGSAYADPWTTPGGRRIDAWKGEHARTLIGFKGSVENPTSFIINDPLSGRVTWSAAKLRSNWGIFNFSGVVVE